jgi:hypothetical protein
VPLRFTFVVTFPFHSLPIAVELCHATLRDLGLFPFVSSICQNMPAGKRPCSGAPAHPGSLGMSWVSSVLPEVYFVRGEHVVG